jgi:hypothetical protein
MQAIAGDVQLGAARRLVVVASGVCAEWMRKRLPTRSALREISRLLCSETVINDGFSGLFGAKDGTLYATTTENGVLTVYRKGVSRPTPPRRSRAAPARRVVECRHQGLRQACV